MGSTNCTQQIIVFKKKKDIKLEERRGWCQELERGSGDEYDRNTLYTYMKLSKGKKSFLKSVCLRRKDKVEVYHSITHHCCYYSG